MAEIQAGASVTSIEKGFDGKMKQIFSPLLGGSLEADIDGNWKLVFDARIEKELASVGASASYDYRTINASIGVEARKEAGRKVVELRPALKLKTTPETFGGLLQGKLPEGPPEARKDKKPNRIDFARILKFPQPYTSEALFIDAHSTFDERRAHRDIAVEK